MQLKRPRPRYTLWLRYRHTGEGKSFRFPFMLDPDVLYDERAITITKRYQAALPDYEIDLTYDGVIVPLDKRERAA